LGKDAALVCVAFEVVDRIEDVVTEIPLMEVEVTLCLGLRSVVASSCKSAGDVANKTSGVVDDGSEAVS